MHRHSLLILGMSSLVFTACGGSLSKLNDEQKSTVKQTLHSAQNSYGAVHHAASQSNPQLQNNSFSSFLFVDENETETHSGHSHTGHSHTLNQNRLTMQDRIQAGVTEQKCNIQSSPMLGDQIEIPSIQVSGSDCPLTFNLRGQIDEKQKTATIRLDYQVQEGDYRKLNDIDAAKLEASLKMEEKSASGKLKGTLHSQSHSEIKIDADLDMSQKEEKTRIRMDYPNFSAEFKVEKTQSGAKYTLNGEELTEEQFQNFFTGFTK